MKLTMKAIEKVNENLWNKKKENPMNGSVIGIGVNMHDSFGGATVFKDNWGLCELEELGRMIDELTMLKEAIEEETGVMI